MNTRSIDGVNQINCLGYFNCKWFNFESLMSKQKEIYDFIKELKRENKNAEEMMEWYDVTEYMRVKLLKSK